MDRKWEGPWKVLTHRSVVSEQKVAEDKSTKNKDPDIIRFRERASFGISQFASNLVWTTISSFLLFFYTDVAMIGAAAAGAIILLARIADGIFDPLVGTIVDRTRSRWGKARPYMLFASPVLAILMVLTFLAPMKSKGTAIAWAATTFLLAGFAYSLVNVPVSSLMALVTTDSKVRLSLSGYQMFGIGAGLVVVSGLTQPLVAKLGGSLASKSGFAWTMSIYAFASVLLFWLAFAWVRESGFLRLPRAPRRRVDGKAPAS